MTHGAIYLLFISLSVQGIQVTGQACTGLAGSVVLSNLPYCDYDTLLAAYTDTYNDDMNRCDDVSAVDDFHAKLGAAGPIQAKSVVKEICKAGQDEKGYTPFTDVALQGSDYRFEKEYFDGNSYFNEEVQTIYNYPVGTQTQILKRDADSVDEFKNGPGEKSQVEFPTQISNFEACDMNAVFCCWVSDRQANDNNGNCDDPEDVNCVDKEPGDNTDLCYVDLSRGNASTEFSSNGSALFPGDDNNNSDEAEGRIHCHGLAWGNDPTDFTSRYKGNNLMFVSLYDHMHQRGYVRNVPGAPMCACAEQMPVVSRADCTQIDVEEEYKVTFLGGEAGASGWIAELTYIDITFNACQGENGESNDLWAYARQLYLDKKITDVQLASLSRVLVEQDNCPYAIEYMMNQKGFEFGYDPNLTDNGSGPWVHLAGRDSLKRDSGNLGGETFNDLYAESEAKIIQRVCVQCDATHQEIFLRYAEGFDPQSNILYWLKTSYPRDTAMMGTYGRDFFLYSTYDDALNRSNPWECDYNMNTYFPGNCAPNGSRNGQGAVLERGWGGPDGQPDVGYYIESTFVLDSISRSVGNYTFTGTDIGTHRYGDDEGSFEMSNSGSLYVRAGGADIWNDKDHGYFVHHEEEDGNMSIKVRIESWEDDTSSWSKGCIMIRKSLDPSSSYYANCIYGKNGFSPQWRETDGGGSGNWNDMYNQDIDSGWLLISKRGLTFTAYRSQDGVDWEQIGDEKVMPDEFQSDTYQVGFMLTSNYPGLMVEAQLENYEFGKYAMKYTCAVMPDI